MTKFILSLLMLTLVDGQLTACLRRWTLRDSVVRAGLPALIYTVQNILLQIAYGLLASRGRAAGSAARLDRTAPLTPRAESGIRTLTG